MTATVPTAPAPNPEDTPMTLDQKIRQHRALVGHALPAAVHDDVLRVQSAVRAVLDLHRPHDVHHTEPVDGNAVMTDRLSHQACGECSDEDFLAALDGGDLIYLSDGVVCPCPTVTAIASALGIDLAAVTG